MILFFLKHTFFQFSSLKRFVGSAKGSDRHLRFSDDAFQKSVPRRHQASGQGQSSSWAATSDYLVPENEDPVKDH